MFGYTCLLFKFFNQLKFMAEFYPLKVPKCDIISIDFYNLFETIAWTLLGFDIFLFFLNERIKVFTVE